MLSRFLEGTGGPVQMELCFCHTIVPRFETIQELLSAASAAPDLELTFAKVRVEQIYLREVLASQDSLRPFLGPWVQSGGRCVVRMSAVWGMGERC